MRSVFSIDCKNTRFVVRLAGFAIVCGLAAGQLLAQCTGDAPNVVTVTSGSASQQAADCLETDGTFTVTGSSNIHFEAGTSIYLMQGFEAQAGTSGTAFTASIGPKITTPQLIGGYIGYPYGFPYNPPYGFQLNAQEGSSFGPFTWTVSGLPGGLSASAGGYISGTVSTSDSATSYTVTATATDALGRASLTSTFTVQLIYAVAVALSSSPALPVAGNTVTLTATATREVAGGYPPGTTASMKFQYGSMIISTASWSSGVATSSPFTYTGGSDNTFYAYYTGHSPTDDSSLLYSLSVPGTSSQTITFASPSGAIYGGSSSLSASASSGLPVSFMSTTLSICTVSGNTATFLSAGTCSITASQTGNSMYSAATPVTRSFTVGQLTQQITFYGPSNVSISSSPLTVSASASSGLPVIFTSGSTSICTVSGTYGTTVTLVTTGTCTIWANQAGDSNHSAAAAVSQSFTVYTSTLIPQTITFGPLSSEPLSAGTVTLSATVSSSLTITYSTTGTVCSVSGSTVTLLTTGACSITASQAGSSTYAPATPVTQTFSVDSSCSGGTIPLREYIRLGGRVVAIENWCD